MRDWIAPVEAAYSLEGSFQEWLDHALDACAPLLGSGAPTVAFAYSSKAVPRALNLRSSREAEVDLLARYALSLRPDGSPVAAQMFPLLGTVFSSLSEQLLPNHPAEVGRFQALTGFRDVIGLNAETGIGYAVSIASLTRDLRRPTARERRIWSRVAAHLGAGMRLRLAIDDATETHEAVLDANGRMHDASGAAQGARAREWLRAAVRDRERARANQQRRDPDRALPLWEGLVAGRWSLVDRFESDGKRFVVAHQNDPDVGDPRGLTRRERQIAEYLGMGRSLKEIAYLLGVGPSSVSNAVARAAAKLGLSGRAELAAFFAPSGLRARLSTFELRGGRLAAGAAPILDDAALAELSDAQREIAFDLLRGATVAAIAQRRGSSPLTVESQVKSIYAKLEVGSRVELAARVAGRRAG